MNLRKIEAIDLFKYFDGRRVVNGVTLNVTNGEVVGLLGPNGAGKTTTFFMIVGIYKPDGGKILLDGKDITSLPVYQRARAGITYLPQESSIFRKLTVKDNLKIVLESLELSKIEMEAKIKRILIDMGLINLSHNKAYTLSGGERRRLEIARALAVSPLFLLLDEPFTGVDPIAVNEIKKIISTLKDRNIGVIISDHNVRETLSICDRAYIINEGKIFAEGVPEVLIHDELVKTHYLGQDFRM